MHQRGREGVVPCTGVPPWLQHMAIEDEERQTREGLEYEDEEPIRDRVPSSFQDITSYRTQMGHLRDDGAVEWQAWSNSASGSEQRMNADAGGQPLRFDEEDMMMMLM